MQTLTIRTLLITLLVTSGAVLSSFIMQEERKGYQVGDEATDFSLKNVDGKMVSLKDFKKAKGFIVVFTCNHCPYSVAYEDRLIELHNLYALEGYPVIAINPNDPEVQPEDSYEKMKVRSKEKKFPFVYLFDEGQKIYPQYGATRTPHIYILSKQSNQKLIVEYIGAIDNNSKDAKLATEHYAKDAITSLLNGSKPEITNTKAIGCTIKAKS